MSKSILITGGTGSLARAYIERALKYNIYERIVVYSRCEHKQETMREQLTDDRIRYFLGDVRDKERLNLAMRGCNYVLHTAALKIVPKLETDPIEAVKTNIYGTQNVIECALNASMYSGKKFYSEPRIVLNVSTDKAVNPINLYGATKLAAEKLISAANVYNPIGVKFATVRWGNIAGSKSSVIPLFREQKKKKLQYTVTNGNMTRFYITLEEGAKFVDYALEEIVYDRPQTLFVPDMPAYKVSDLLEAISGKKDITYKQIGTRPGEKLHESILTHEEREQYKLYDRVISSDLARRMSVKELKIALKSVK